MSRFSTNANSQNYWKHERHRPTPVLPGAAFARGRDKWAARMPETVPRSTPPPTEDPTRPALLRTGTTTMTANVRIGTSGWNYDHWRGGFYPEDLPQRDWFSHYAKHFSTVEINNTFYHQPDHGTFDDWRGQAPEGFVYSVKANRYLTHLKHRKDAVAPGTVGATDSRVAERVRGLARFRAVRKSVEPLVDYPPSEGQAAFRTGLEPTRLRPSPDESPGSRRVDCLPNRSTSAIACGDVARRTGTGHTLKRPISAKGLWFPRNGRISAPIVMVARPTVDRDATWVARHAATLHALCWT